MSGITLSHELSIEHEVRIGVRIEVFPGEPAQTRSPREIEILNCWLEKADGTRIYLSEDAEICLLDQINETAVDVAIEREIDRARR
jgi:hypothetical protein